MMYDVEAEKSFLSCLLIDPGIINHALTLINEDHFFKPINKHIYKAVSQLYAMDYQVDIITIQAKLKNNNQNVIPAYISGLTELRSTAANYITYADIIYENYIRRQIIEIYKQSQKTIRQDNVQENIGIVVLQLQRLCTERYSEKSIKEHVQDALKFIQENKKQDVLKTEYYKWDKTIGGLRGGELHIVAGRPSSGKSALAINIVVNILKKNKYRNILFFSLEMHPREHIFRMCARIKNINNQNVRNGLLNQGDLSSVINYFAELAESNLHIVSGGRVTIETIKKDALIQQIKKGKLDLIIIDHLQLISSHGKNINRYELLTEITRELKILAQKIDVPVLCLSQLSRNIEQRLNEEPRLSDLRGSGSIEQDADTVSILKSQNSNMKKLYVLKNRSGKINEINFNFEGDLMKFEER